MQEQWPRGHYVAVRAALRRPPASGERALVYGIGTLAHGTETLPGDAERITTFDLTVRWLLEGKIQTDGLLTHRFRLDDYRQAIQAAVDKRSTQSVKMAFDFR